MLVLLTLFIGAVTLIYLWLRYHAEYWLRRDIPHDKAHLIFGNMQRWNKDQHITDIFMDYYRKYKGTGPFAGFKFFGDTAVIVTDLDLIKNILIKDFNKFDSRGIYHNERDDPLTGNLFFIDGEKWRRLRHKMTPTFTSGKMKHMFSAVVKVGQELNTVIAQKVNATEKPVFELVDLLARYTADVIGICAFGIECNSLHNPKAEFVVMGKQFFVKPRNPKIVDGIIHSNQKLAKALHMRVISDDVHNFYMKLVRDTIKFREENNIKRQDFMDMLIDLKNQKDDNGLDGLTVEEVAAQAFVFLIAGFETSSTTMGFALYELAQHQEIQDKTRKEVTETLAKYNGELTYECLKEMTYLDQVIDETLRKHPVLGHLIRKAQERYETSDPKYYIEKKTLVVIPSRAIHYDPEIYPEPEKFDPERFSPDEVKNRPPCTWLAFGDGPRNCIGLRFGKMQASIGLALLLKDFKFSVALETEIPYKLILKSFIISSENGIKLRVEKISQ